MPHTLLLRDLLQNCARSYPEKPAYIEGLSERTRTWQEINERSSRLAVALQKLNIGKDDATCVLAHDIIEVIEHLFACLKNGAWRVGINWRFSSMQILHVIRNSEAKAVIIQNCCLPLIEKDDLAALEANGVKLIGIGEGHGLSYDYNILINESTPACELPPISGDDVCAISYTTGTTGMPKGALWTHNGIREALVYSSLALGLHTDDVWFNPFPMPGVPILLGALSLTTAMTTVLPGGDFKPDLTLKMIERFKISATIFVPTQLKRIVEEAQNSDRDLSSLRFVAYGSAPVTSRLIREAYTILGCNFAHVYGLTEATWGLVSCLTPDGVQKAMREKPHLLASAGPPALHLEVSIRNSKDGSELICNEQGEIWVRGPTIMKGYWKLPEKTDEVITRDGWLKTGDIGCIDKEGYLYIVDRKSFMIISGGYNVYPASVEEVIAEHPAVREVAVIGIPHPEWGEAVVSVISLKPDAEVREEEIQFYCRDQRARLSRFEVPKRIILVDELPKGVTGKIDKLKLRNQFASLFDVEPR